MEISSLRPPHHHCSAAEMNANECEQTHRAARTAFRRPNERQDAPGSIHIVPAHLELTGGVPVLATRCEV